MKKENEDSDEVLVVSDETLVIARLAGLSEFSDEILQERKADER